MATQKKDKRKKKEPHSHPADKNLKRNEAALKTTGLQLAGIAAAIGFILYISTTGYKYAYDDFSAIKENYLIQKGISSIGTLLHTSYRYGYWSANDELYRPLSLVTFALEWQFFPNSPGFAHFINVLLYALTGFLLFRFLHKLFPNNFNVPFIATVLFMAHPIHTEAVANIKSRDEIMSFLLGILSLSLLLDYIKTKKMTVIIVSVVAFFLALLSKETAITLIAIVPLMLYTFSNMTRQKILRFSLPFLGVGLFYLVIRSIVLKNTDVKDAITLLDNVIAHAPNIWSRFATAMYVLLRYAWLLVFPLHMSFDYSYPEITIHKLFDYKVLISMALYLGIFVYSVIKIIRKDKISFGILFYLITLSIGANIFILIGTVMADRLLYLPSLGFCIAVAVLLNKLFKAPSALPAASVPASMGLMTYLKNNKNILWVTAIITGLYSFKTIDRNPVWEDNISLYQSGLIDAPNSSKTHYLYGIEIKNRYANEDTDSTSKAKDLNEAEKELLVAVKLYPNNAQAYRELGTIYLKRNKFKEALQYFDKALALIPNDNITLNNKGVIYAKVGNIKKALELVKQSVKYSPRYVDGLRNIGACYSIEKNLDSAIIYFNEALKYSPTDIPTLKYLAAVYKDKGDQASSSQYEEAAKKAEDALKSAK